MQNAQDLAALRWLHEDAIFLQKSGRLRGCLCLLLCLIDGLAKQQYPDIKLNRDRYTRFLREALAAQGIDVEHRVEEKNRVVHLADIVYEYFRCNIVHEGNSRDDRRYEVQVEYEPSGRFYFNSAVLVDRVNNKLVYRAEKLISVLFRVSDSIFHIHNNSLKADGPDGPRP